MKITAIETVPVFRAVRPELTMKTAAGKHLESNYLLLAVRTAEGVTGWGEFTGTYGWSGEIPEGARFLIEDYIAPLLIGRDCAEADELFCEINRVIAYNPFAKAARTGVGGRRQIGRGRRWRPPTAARPHRTSA